MHSTYIMTKCLNKVTYLGLQRALAGKDVNKSGSETSGVIVKGNHGRGRSPARELPGCPTQRPQFAGEKSQGWVISPSLVQIVPGRHTAKADAFYQMMYY